MKLYVPLPTLSVLLLCSLVLTGCSIRFTYNFFGWWLRWSIRSYVSLEKDQRAYVKNTIEEFHLWHRKTQLPTYAATLRRLQSDLSNTPVDSVRLSVYAEQLLSYWDCAIGELTEPAIYLAARLTDQQIIELVHNLEKQQREFYEEHVEPEQKKLQKQHAQRLIDKLQSWVGRLSKQQKQSVYQWSEDIHSYGELALRQRQLWQKQLQAVLSKRQDTNYLQQEIPRLMFYPQELWQPQYRKALAVNRQITLQFLADLINSFDEKQHQKLNRTITDYIDDLTALSAKD